jgi:hypothetical protein
MNSRKPEGNKHKFNKSGEEHVLYHREAGSSGPEARARARKNEINEVDLDFQETLYLNQRPISPIRDPVLVGSHPYLPRTPVFERFQPKLHKITKEIPRPPRSNLASMPSLEDLPMPPHVDFWAEKAATESTVLPEVEVTKEDMATIISSPTRKVVLHQTPTVEQTVPVNITPAVETPDYTAHFNKVLPQINELKELNTYENRVSLCVGGKYFDTTTCTLMKEPTSVLALISGLASLNSDNKIFTHRDPSHFKFIPNYLTYDNRKPAGGLPADPQVLHELRQEAEYY